MSVESGRPRVVGEKDRPSYDFEFEGVVQPTLDGFRAYSIFERLIPRFDSYIDGELDTAIMYGSNTKGVSSFPDSEVHGFDSDVDLYLVVSPREDLENIRESYSRFMDKEFSCVPDVNADIKEKGDVVELMNNLAGSEVEEFHDINMTIEYPYHEFDTSAVKRLRAFGDGYIVHPDFDGEVSQGIRELMDRISDNGFVREELAEEYLEGMRNYSDRIDTIKV